MGLITVRPSSRHRFLPRPLTFTTALPGTPSSVRTLPTTRVRVLVDRARLPSEIDAQAAAETVREIEKQLPFAEPAELPELQDRLLEAEAQVAVARAR